MRKNAERLRLKPIGSWLMPVKLCEPCAFLKRKTKATTGYVSVFSGEKTHCCRKCLTEYEQFKAHMTDPPISFEKDQAA